MLPCQYCLGGSGDHGECDAEYDRRRGAGLCVRCGEAAADAPDLRCGPCESIKHYDEARPVYVGYPGGGT